MLMLSSIRLNSLIVSASRPALHLVLVLLTATPVWGDLALDVVTSTDRSSPAQSISSPAFTTASRNELLRAVITTDATSKSISSPPFTAASRNKLSRAAIATDATSKSISSPAFTTHSGNELLLALIATDSTSAGVTVTGVTGASATWVLVKRTNSQLGTAEIWRAFAPSVLSSASVTASLSQSVAASITVVTFTGADPSGTSGSGAIGNTAGASAASGAPSASLVTTRNGSWVFGVGNDWNSGARRRVGTNQTMVHLFLAATGDTCWVQRQNAPTALSQTQVFMNDPVPKTDRYNLSIVEVLAAASSTRTLSISGTISPVSSGVGTLVTLSGAANASVTADTKGNYSFAGLTNGSYAVTPAKAGYTFSPPNQAVSSNGTSVPNVNFTATPVPTWSISGTVNPATLGSGTLLTLSGTPSATTTADTNGNYSFTGLANGNFTVTPTKTGYSFTPPARRWLSAGPTWWASISRPKPCRLPSPTIRI